jgi:NAD-dependent DNA ligase
MTVRYNEKFIDLMEQLSAIMSKQGEPFRARAYQKAQETIMAFPGDITSPEDLKGKPGIGETIMEKLNEFVSTGTLKILEREKNNPVNILAEVYGIGPKKAKELVEAGITSIEQLRKVQDKHLNDVQKVGLKYYEDILKRIPRSEVQNYETIFKKTFQQVISASEDQALSGLDTVAPEGSLDTVAPEGSLDTVALSGLEIVGSYRRGAETSGDIDVIITSENPKVFVQFIDLLVQEKVIVEILSRGPTKCLVITKIPSSDSYRRVDFLYTNLEEYPFSILYFTGSKSFNTVMRHQALSMGLTMNEHGLYKMEGKKKGEKVDVIFKSEKDIFNYLHMEYKSPKERTDGRSVVLIKEGNKSISNNSQNEPINAQSLKTKTKKIKKTTNKIDAKKTMKKTNSKKKLLIIEEENGQPEKKEKEEKIVDKKEKKAVKEKEKEKKKEELGDPFVLCVVHDFKKNGIHVINKLEEKHLSLIIKEANKAYYNSTPIMTDNEFDILKEYVQNKYPSNEAIVEIGAPIERNKVKLPYEMASMDKIKPDTKALSTWTQKYKGPYVLSCKLDGVSGLYTTEGEKPKLYTRGDGKTGQDISHLIPYLKLPKTKNIVIRGEFIVTRKIFQDKYAKEFANPRNMVAGIINHKTVNQKIKDLSFVAYEVIEPVLKPSEQMKFLESLKDVVCVLNHKETTLTNEILSAFLVDWRTNYAYEIDGVIVTNDEIYPRKSGNPDHAFAFKMVLSDQVAEAKVVDVLWTPSKDGYLKPRVQIEPISLGGVRIEYATGFNGSFIHDHKIGVGAIIELIRSGDVIPYIRKVIVPAEEARMPSVPYVWNDTHIDVLLEDVGSDKTVKEKNITGFFRGICVEGLSSGNILRIIQAGYLSVPEILAMKKDDFLKVDGFKEKMAQKIYEGIVKKVEEASLITFMSASNIFGRGFSEKKIELIMEGAPDILVSKESDSKKTDRLKAIKGMAGKTAEAFVARIEEFVEFMKACGLEKKLMIHQEKKKNSEVVSLSSVSPLFEKTIIITGFRDKALEESLKKVGAKLGSSVSKNTFLVIVKDLDETTGKVLDAKKNGIPIITYDEFQQKYL